VVTKGGRKMLLKKEKGEYREKLAEMSRERSSFAQAWESNSTKLKEKGRFQISGEGKSVF